MEIDEERIDEAVQALLYLTLHDGGRAWKSFDWDTTGRRQDKDLIQNPVSKAKSVLFTEEDKIFFEKQNKSGIYLGTRLLSRIHPEIWSRSFSTASLGSNPGNITNLSKEGFSWE